MTQEPFRAICLMTCRCAWKRRKKRGLKGTIALSGPVPCGISQRKAFLSWFYIIAGQSAFTGFHGDQFPVIKRDFQCPGNLQADLPAAAPVFPGNCDDNMGRIFRQSGGQILFPCFLPHFFSGASIRRWQRGREKQKWKLPEKKSQFPSYPHCPWQKRTWLLPKGRWWWNRPPGAPYSWGLSHGK